MFAITTDNPMNSLFSPGLVLHAIYNLNTRKCRATSTARCRRRRCCRRSTSRGTGQISPSDDIPTQTRHPPSRARQRPLNLVIVLEESLGATFVESLGGIPVTPELEKLKSQGWWFEQMYATGTRSVRGIEAVVAGFPPTPSQSVVKLSLSQSNFFSLASLLARHGYHTEFIYGGESHFDNMNGFFRGNGFQSVIDQKDFAAPGSSAVGVSDEDLFNKTHERLSMHHAGGEPFFSLVFSCPTTRRSSFQTAASSCTTASRPRKTTPSSADYALGRFEQARNSPYWEDTLRQVVADHDIARGESLPVKNFHILA